MSPRGLGLVVAALAILLWGVGALVPAHPSYLTALDLRWYFFPTYEAFYGALRSGELMLWNPYQLGGIPGVGTLQGGFFYPFHVLYVLLPTGWALAASTVLHLALAAGTGTAFARRAGLSASAATLAGAVFALAGLMRQCQLWPYLLEAYAWAPLGAIGILELCDGARARGALILAVATGASLLAGCPQGTVFAGYAWAGLLVAQLASRREVIANQVRTVAAAAGALTAGGLLAAVTLLPAYELAQEGLRNTSTLPPESLYQFGMPPLVDVARTWLVSGSRVLLPAFLTGAVRPAGRPGLAHGVGHGRRRPRASAGARTPHASHSALPRPTVSRVVPRAPAPPAARAVLPRHPRRSRARHPHEAGPLALRRRRDRGPDPDCTGPSGPHRAASGTAPALPAGRRSLDVGPARRVRAAGAHGGERPRLAVQPWTSPATLPPKLPTITRVRAITDYEPLALRRQSEFFTYFAQGSIVYAKPDAPFDGRISTLTAPKGREPPATRRRLLDLTATRFMVMPTPTLSRADVVAFVRDAGIVPRPPVGPGIEIVENPHALPRAFVTYRARRAPAVRQLLAHAGAGELRPAPRELGRGRGRSGVRRGRARAWGATATVVRDDPQVVEVQATLAAPGLVVLADTYRPAGARPSTASPAPILATNHLFRGVPRARWRRTSYASSIDRGRCRSARRSAY